MKKEIVEICPTCGSENVFMWDTEEFGYLAFCHHCGSQMLLCDECCHEVTQENPEGECCLHCDWHIGEDGKGCCRRSEQQKEMEVKK